MKNMMKTIDAAFAEWYKMNGLDPMEDMDDDHEDEAAKYVARKLNMTDEELDWYLNL